MKYSYSMAQAKYFWFFLKLTSFNGGEGLEKRGTFSHILLMVA